MCAVNASLRRLNRAAADLGSHWMSLFQPRDVIGGSFAGTGLSARFARTRPAERSGAQC